MYIIMKILLPMSGQGSRFVTAGYTDPKPLIEVDGKPMIYHVMDMFPGEADIHCICNREHLETTRMREVLEARGAKVHAIESHTLGPVYACAQIFDSVEDDEEVIVSYCDYGTVWDYEAFLREVREADADGAIAAYKGFHPHMLGTDNYAFLRCRRDATGREWLQEIREKEPFTSDRMSEYASNGTYYFRRGADLKHVFSEMLASEGQWMKNGEYYVSLAYNLMVMDGRRVMPFVIEKMLQWGTPRDLEEYRMWSRHFKRRAGAADLDVKDRCVSSARLILPLAGKGSRFTMQGYTDPKPLLDVHGAPMIVRAVQDLPTCTAKTFLCLEEHLAAYPLQKTLQRAFRDTEIASRTPFGDAQVSRVAIDVFSLSETTNGQATTVNIGLDKAGVRDDEAILISACDNGVDFDPKAYAALEADPDVDVIVWSYTNNPTGQRFPHMYAWMDVDEATKDIRHVNVKKALAGARHAIIGTMFFRRAGIFRKGLQAIYDADIRTNGEFYVDDMLNPLIAAGYKVKVFEVDAYICWGTPNDYKTYNYWLEHFQNVWALPERVGW